MGGPAHEIPREEIFRENFTKSDAFIFCDLCLKPAEYEEINGATTAPRVTFQKTGRDAPVIEGRKAAKAHHNAEHKR